LRVNNLFITGSFGAAVRLNRFWGFWGRSESYKKALHTILCTCKKRILGLFLYITGHICDELYIPIYWTDHYRTKDYRILYIYINIYYLLLLLLLSYILLRARPVILFSISRNRHTSLGGRPVSSVQCPIARFA
jgi:hypothetical protein